MTRKEEAFGPAGVPQNIKNGDEVLHDPALAEVECLQRLTPNEESSQFLTQLHGQQSGPQGRGLSTTHTQQ